MSGKITIISDSEFDKLVIMPKKPAVVFFSAVWAGACRMARPILETAAEKYSQKVSFYELNIDNDLENQMKYQVTSLPTIIIFANGEVCGRLIGGGINRDKVNEILDKIIISGAIYNGAMAFSKKLSAQFGGRFGA